MEETKQPKKVARTMLKIIIIIILLVAILIIGFLYYFNQLIKTPIGSNTGAKLFEIKKEQDLETVASKLYGSGFIKSSWAFVLNARIKKIDIQPAVYDFSESENIVTIADRIDKGQTNVKRITIPEGWRTEQIGQRLAENEVCSYSEFVAEAARFEGKLFPDTYFFSTKNSITEIIKAMNDNYLKKTADLNLSDEDLIIASIVEREAINDEERKLIAGVYKNRIARGMRLEADPTVQYGKDNNQIKNMTEDEIVSFKLWQPITIKDYRTTDSPYNTYLIKSLPPGPICNPGIKSIEATLDYGRHNYLFFLQSNGEIYPSRTEAEHNQYRKTVLGADID